MNAVVLAKNHDSNFVDRIVIGDGYERYYNINYERGNWPLICSSILQAMSEYELVYYASDICNDCDVIDGPPTTLEEIFEISKHWVENGNKPYFNR